MIIKWLVFVVVAALTATHDPVSAQELPSPALLVGEKSAGLLAIVDPGTGTVLAHIPANPNVHEVASDDTYAYVSNSNANAITVIDLAARRQIAGIELGVLGPVHGLWTAGGKLYFANETARTIGRYDPVSRRIDWVLGTGQPGSHLLVVSRDTSRIYTANGGAGTVSIIERTSAPQAPGRPTARPDWSITVVPAGSGVEGLDVAPDGGELWAVNVRDKTISVIDLRSKRSVATIPIRATYSNRLKFTPDGRYVLASDLRGTEVIVFDAASRSEIKRIGVGGGSEGILMDPDGSRAFVAVSGADKVVVVDLRSLAISAEIAGLRNPDGMAWVQGR